VRKKQWLHRKLILQLWPYKCGQWNYEQTIHGSFKTACHADKQILPNGG
jgi:hypothetical protein